jgi:O-antigen/teichoic acid export membrane protein
VSLGRNAVASGAQAASAALLLFLTYRYLLQELTPDEFGLWALLVAIAGVARIADFGLGAAAARFVATDLGNRQVDRAARVVQTLAMTAALASGTVVIVSWLLSSLYLPWLVPASALLPAAALLPYMLASLALQIVSTALLGGLEGAQRYELRAAVVLSGYVMLLAGCLVLVPRLGLVGVGLAQVLQGVLTTVVAWLLVRRQLRVASWLPVDASIGELRRIASFSAGFQAIAIAQLAVELLVKLALSRYAGLAATGLFEVAQRITQQLRAPLVAACQVLVPAVAEKRAGDPQVVRLYSRAAALLSLLSTGVFAGLLIALPLLTIALLGRFDALLWTITVILAIAWLLNTLSVPSYYALLGLGTTRWHVLGHVLIVVVTAALAWPLGSVYGIGGIVAAYGVALVVGGAVVVVVFHRRMQVPYVAGLSAGAWLVGAIGAAGTTVTLLMAQRGAAGLLLAGATGALLVVLAAVLYLGWQRSRRDLQLAAAGS